METTIIISIIISLIIINIAATVLLILRVKTVLLNRTDNLANNLSNGLRYNLSNLDTEVRRRGSDTSYTLIKMTKHLDSISATIETLSENVNSIAIDNKNITTKQSATNIVLDDLTKDVFLNDTYPTIKDDGIADNDFAAKAKEEKWLTNEFLDNLEYVATPNPRGSCKNCVLDSICNDLGLRDKVVKSEDVRIRTRDIIRRCLIVNGYYIKKDK